MQVVCIRTGYRGMSCRVGLMRRDNPDLLFPRVADLENHIQILVKGHGMPGGSAKEFDGDYVVLVNGRELQSKIVTLLQGGIAGESGIAGNMLQGTRDFIVADSDSRLQSTYVLAKNFRPAVFGFNSGTY